MFIYYSGNGTSASSRATDSVREDEMSNGQTPQDQEHEKKLQELKRDTDLAVAEKAKLDAEKGLVEAQKALDAQKSRDVDDDLKAKTAAETSQKLLADAEKARIEAQRSLERARKPPDAATEDLLAKTAAAKGAKELAEAQKAAADASRAEADASKAKADADLAAFKARFGDVPTSPYKGEVTLKENAGKTEAMLLAAQAVRGAAAAIFKTIRTEATDVMLFASADVPTFDSLMRFNVEIGIVKKAFVIAEFETLAQRRATGLATAAEHERLEDRWTNDAAKEADKKKEEMMAAAEAHKHAADAIHKAIALYDSWFNKLLSPDEKTTVVPIVAVIREKSMRDALGKGRSLLITKVHASGGSYYAKKNIWTVFGGMPFFHMGGTVASFVLIKGQTGEIAAAGTVPVHGGFWKATRLENEIATRPGPPARRKWAERLFGRADWRPTVVGERL